MKQLSHRTALERNAGSDRPLVIGLVNNSSDRALKSAEAQFLRVLIAGAQGRPLHVKFFTCPEIPRCERPAGDLEDPYADLDTLYTTHLDAMIVTGTEPQASTLPEEPIWGSLTKLVDWAEDNAIPTVWSCLAAHAAALHLDGLSRAPLPGKLSGLFECNVIAAGHVLMADLPSRWICPHSRYNGISADALATRGYEVLSASAEASVDIFARDGAAPFIFFQGHPEYDGDTLLREYKRDVRRYLAGEKNEYPALPRNYFTSATASALDELRRDALRGRRDLAMLDMVSSVAKRDPRPAAWRGPAARLYANWLNSVERQFRRPRFDIGIGALVDEASHAPLTATMATVN